MTLSQLRDAVLGPLLVEKFVLTRNTKRVFVFAKELDAGIQLEITGEEFVVANSLNLDLIVTLDMRQEFLRPVVDAGLSDQIHRQRIPVIQYFAESLLGLKPTECQALLHKSATEGQIAEFTRHFTSNALQLIHSLCTTTDLAKELSLPNRPYVLTYSAGYAVLKSLHPNAFSTSHGK